MYERHLSWLRRRFWTPALVGALSVLLVGCEFESRSELAPGAPSAVTITPVLLGTWSFRSAAPVSSGIPAADSCTELGFTFDTQKGDLYSGTFSATCADGVVLTGLASGTLVDDLLTVRADGLATRGGVQCPFTLSGTARLVGQQIAIDYTGTSCLGPVSGSQTLAR